MRSANTWLDWTAGCIALDGDDVRSGASWVGSNTSTIVIK